MKNTIVIIGVIVLIGAAFWGGTVYAGSSDTAGAPSLAADGTRAAGGPGSGFGGGPMANLSEEERTALQSMTEEERQAFLEEQGVDVNAAPGGMRDRGGLLEGEVVDIAEDSLTLALADGGSQTIYTASDTLISYVEGAAELGSGSTVLIFSESEADGIQTARAIVVR